MRYSPSTVMSCPRLNEREDGTDGREAHLCFLSLGGDGISSPPSFECKVDDDFGPLIRSMNEATRTGKIVSVSNDSRQDVNKSVSFDAGYRKRKKKIR